MVKYTTKIMLNMSDLPVNVENRFEPETKMSVVSFKKRLVSRTIAAMI